MPMEIGKIASDGQGGQIPARSVHVPGRPTVQRTGFDLGEAHPGAIDLGDELAALERDVERYQQSLVIACRLTRPEHWLSRASGDSMAFALQGPGAEALCGPYGINWSPPVHRVEHLTDTDGAWYRVETDLTLRSERLRREITTMGYCDSRDEFFLENAMSRARKHLRSSNSASSPKPDEERVRAMAARFISIGDVKKASTTNALVRGVSMMLGIRNPSRELLELAGIDIAAVPQIRYGSGETKTTSGRTDGQAAVITEPQRKRLFAILHEQAKKNASMDQQARDRAVSDAQSEICLALGIDSVSRIPQSRYDEAIAVGQRVLASMAGGSHG